MKREWQNSPAGTRKTDSKNLVWFGEIERKISQIIKDYFYLPFFLLIILCCTQTDPKTSAIVCNHLIGTILDPSLFWPASTFKELFCRKR
jgi:hypothetical protein